MVDRHHIHDLQTPVFFSFSHTEYNTLCSLIPTFKAAFYNPFVPCSINHKHTSSTSNGAQVSYQELTLGTNFPY